MIGKLDIETPMFAIESSATIVAPLMFPALLGWQATRSVELEARYTRRP